MLAMLGTSPGAPRGQIEPVPVSDGFECSCPRPRLEKRLTDGCLNVRRLECVVAVIVPECVAQKLHRAVMLRAIRIGKSQHFPCDWDQSLISLFVRGL